jgi:uncharacterized protein (TIGR00369 family)
MNDARRRTPTPPLDASASQASLESLGATEHPRCVLCGAANRYGMKLEFSVQSDGSVVATFPCCETLQSYPGTLHGGVVSALLDAAMTNVLFSIGVAAVTAELTVRFLAPVRLGQDAVVRASIARVTSRSLYYVRSEIEQLGAVVARASAKFLARSPGLDAIRTAVPRAPHR